jgi:hypothetical protein
MLSHVALTRWHFFVAQTFCALPPFSLPFWLCGETKGDYMAVVIAGRSKEEIARLGMEIYERDILPKIEAGNEGKVVAIDVNTGVYELADELLDSASRLRERAPDAEIFFMRVGERTLRKMMKFARAPER